jgi:hypothetical protein
LKNQERTKERSCLKVKIFVLEKFIQSCVVLNRRQKRLSQNKAIMRPPHFGQDITNTQQNSNSSGGVNEEDDSSERNRQECIISRLAQNGATPVAHIAGKGIIKVVSRCEDAKENSNLGENRIALRTKYLKRSLEK